MARRRDFDSNEAIIVIGSGIAGLLLTIELASAGRQVQLVTKGQLDESNTAWAQGGLAAVTELNTADSVDQHLTDTINAGDGLTKLEAAARIIGGGGQLVRRLDELGVKFDKTSLALEGGHRLARVLHSADATGRAIIDALTAKALSLPGIQIFENCFLTEIITDGNRCIGVELIKESPTRATIIKLFGTVVLCTGGLGKIYSLSTNPPTATGDGIAAAFRAGASLVDMEFVQFHPTALALDGAPAFLISEAVRGAGGILLNSSGERFVQRYFPEGELATRDKVSQAIHEQMKQDGSANVWLDLSSIGKAEVLTKFPNIVARCREFGIDPISSAIPVAPAAHYFMGGILTDADGRTTVPGLYAIGECACTGLHGANRLASNSLLEGGVMAMNLARRIRSRDRDQALPLVKSEAAPRTFRRDILLDAAALAKSTTESITRLDLERFRDRLLHDVGIVRSAESLRSFINDNLAASDTILDTVPTYCTSEAPYFILSTVPYLGADTNTPLCRSDEMGESGNSVIHRLGSTLDRSTTGRMLSDAHFRRCQTVPDGIAENSLSRQHAAERNAAYTLGLLVAQAALLRAESRGAQWREDYPNRDDLNFKGHISYDSSGIAWLPDEAISAVGHARATILSK